MLLLAHGTLLTNNAISFIEVRSAVKAAMGVEMCKACQPQSGVRVCQGKGDAVWARFGGRTPPFRVRTHSIWCLWRAVDATGCQSILVMVPGDLWTWAAVSHVGTEGDIWGDEGSRIDTTLILQGVLWSVMFLCFSGFKICKLRGNICINV